MSKFTDYIDGFVDKTGTLAKYRLSERDQTFKYTRATTSRKFSSYRKLKNHLAHWTMSPISAKHRGY